MGNRGEWMKKIIVFAMPLLFLSVNVFAEDKPRFYVFGSIGFITPNDVFDSKKSMVNIDTGFQGTFAFWCQLLN